jgi:hypothetical protein
MQLRLLQFTQLAPPMPQFCLVVPAMQVVPAQQPFGQDTASHTQLPLTQRAPVPQAAAVPQ